MLNNILKIIICCAAILGIAAFIMVLLNRKRERVRENLLDYRLADMIKHKQWREQRGGFDLHQSQYPKSIATKYMKAVKFLSEDDQNNNLNVLTDILNNSEYRKYKNTKNNIIMHIRAGDVIDNQPYSVDEFLEKQRHYSHYKYNYVKPLSYYQNIVKKLKSMKLPKKIMIITGFHTNDHDYKKSLQYIDRVADFFKSQGYLVSTRINKHPDHDFVFMSTSKYFIPSGGSFSHLVGKMVENNGGKVI